MGPPSDYYYSAEVVGANGRGAVPPPQWASSGLLPPIVELWSSVEGSSSRVGGWDAAKEAELVGEDLPMRVSQTYIDACNEEAEQEVEKAVDLKHCDSNISEPPGSRLDPYPSGDDNDAHDLKMDAIQMNVSQDLSKGENDPHQQLVDMVHAHDQKVDMIKKRTAQPLPAWDVEDTNILTTY